MMGKHEAAETEPPRDVSRVVELKVVGAAAAGLACSVAMAVLDAVQHSPHILDGLPEWSRFIILAAIPPVLIFLAGYAIPSNRV